MHNLQSKKGGRFTIKWFKHDCDARHDTKLQLLKRKFGAEGYGIYFQLLEIIGSHIEKDNVVDWGYVEKIHTVETLADECGVTPDKLRSVLVYCNELELLEKRDGKLFCSKILKRMDEYFQRLESKYKQTPDKLPTNSGYRTEQNRIEKKRKDVDESVREGKVVADATGNGYLQAKAKAEELRRGL